MQLKEKWIDPRGAGVSCCHDVPYSPENGVKRQGDIREAATGRKQEIGMSTIPKGSQPEDRCVKNFPIYSPCFTLEDTSADEGQQIRGSKAMERDAGRMQLPRPMAGWMFPVLLWHPDNQARTVGMLEEDWYHLRTLLVGICQKKRQ